MQRQILIRLGLSLATNLLFCCFLLPLIIPPFGGYSLSQLLEVLLWQGIAMLGWPFALLGIALSLPFGAKLASVASLLLILIYPALQILLVRALLAKTPRRLEFILLHILMALSFVGVWYNVLNGYDFMLG